MDLEGSRAACCSRWEWHVVPAGIVPFPAAMTRRTTGTPGALYAPKYLKHCVINENIWEKGEEMSCNQENFLLEYVYLFLMPNGEHTYWFPELSSWIKTERRGGGVTISVNEKTGYTAWAVGHLAQHLARANQLSCAGISTSDIQFSSLSNAIN